MAWLRRKCPVGEQTGAWVERSFRWFREQFGDEPLHTDPLLPADVIPDGYTGSEDDVHAVLEVLCRHLAVDPEFVTPEFQDEDEAALIRAVRLERPVAQCYRRRDGQVLVPVDHYYLTDPTRLITRMAHELAHVRLLGEERVTTRRRDHEELADLLTVYLGAGIFTANASVGMFGIPERGTGIRMARQFERIGFLSEPQFGYGLACYVWLRGESWPEWTEHLQRDPANLLEDGLRYLEHVAEPGELPGR